jgi:hypothetical protein
LPGVRADVFEEGRFFFFFRKRSKKTFISGAALANLHALRPTMGPKGIKLFCFFFFKKRRAFFLGLNSREK